MIMKKIFISLLCLLTAALGLVSCAGKYSPIKSSDDELRIVGYVGNYPVYYDEFRCSVMNTKKVMGEYYGLDPDSEEFAKEHTEELKNRVFSGLKYNYALQILFADGGYTIEDPDIQASVQSKITELIDECGGKRKYREYLAENYLTDRVQRFNIAISYASSELLYILNDSGALDEYVDFDFTSISFGNIYFNLEDYSAAMDLLYSESMLLNTEYIFISSENADHAKNAEALNLEVIAGASLSELAKNDTSLAYNSLHIVEGTRDRAYFDAAKALSHGESCTVTTDTGSFVIKRLELDVEYVNENYYDLIYTYLSVKSNERTEKFAEGLEFTLTDFGKSIDIIKLK